MTVQVQRLFNGIGDGREKPDYEAIARELKRLIGINNDVFSKYTEKEQALSDVGKISAGLFNRALLLDGGNPDDYD